MRPATIDQPGSLQWAPSEWRRETRAAVGPSPLMFRPTCAPSVDAIPEIGFRAQCDFVARNVHSGGTSGYLDGAGGRSARVGNHDLHFHVCRTHPERTARFERAQIAASAGCSHDADESLSTGVFTAKRSLPAADSPDSFCTPVIKPDLRNTKESS